MVDVVTTVDKSISLSVSIEGNAPIEQIDDHSVRSGPMYITGQAEE
jgi:hypothetical protein